MAKVLGIGGVFIKADDPKKLSAWYENALGFRPASGGPVVFQWRHADGTAKPGMTVWSLFKRSSDYFGPGGQAVMVNYIVDDLDGMLTALKAAGVNVDERREDTEYGRFGWATDPEGNRFELWQPPQAT
jgi:predicted enzyme related to lactoylglutathione lyase